MDFQHKSVLLNECIKSLDIKPNGIYVDGTLGGAGHSYEICKILNNNGRLIGIDQDRNALEAAKEKLSEFKNVTFVHSNFSGIHNVLDSIGIDKIDGALLDIGVSSYQLDEPSRGFSYMNDAPLDMRMDRSREFKAYDIVNVYPEQDLCDVIFKYGEEKWAKRIAHAIVEKRRQSPIETTFELSEIIKGAIPAAARRNGPHPSKRTFQALRIEVNSELEVLENSINDFVDRLNSGGRLCIITFHSLEDRIVKNAFRALEKPCTCPSDFPVCICGKEPLIKIITKKPIVPSEYELEQNHRSRSAKLRVAEKL